MSGWESRTRLRDLFEVSLAGEMRGLRFYQNMARAFAHIATAGIFFSDMAQDEAGHIATIMEIRTKLSAAQLEQGIDPEQLRRAAGLRELITTEQVQAIQTLDEAYELTNEYEASELNRLFLYISSQGVSAEDRHALLTAEISNHQNKVSLFGQAPQDRSWRRSIQAQHELSDEDV